MEMVPYTWHVYFTCPKRVFYFGTVKWAIFLQISNSGSRWHTMTCLISKWGRISPGVQWKWSQTSDTCISCVVHFGRVKCAIYLQISNWACCMLKVHAPYWWLAWLPPRWKSFYIIKAFLAHHQLWHPCPGLWTWNILWIPIGLRRIFGD